VSRDCVTVAIRADAAIGICGGGPLNGRPAPGQWQGDRVFGMEMGPWSEWAGAGVAALAFAATLVLLRQQQRTVRDQAAALDLQRAQVRAQDDAQLRAQAEKFWAWLGDRPGTKTRNTGVGGASIQFHNGSDLFIYEAVAVLRDWRTGAEPVDPAAPIDPPYGQDYVAMALAVPPGDSYEMMAGPIDGAMGFRAGIEVSFTDAAGRRWRRAIGGPLQQLPEGAVTTYGFHYPILGT
jgi:hypothetical protein